ncbi:hypothetical protein MAJHIDBO_00132 [Propionibacterium freudenreichii subsp. shermanii]|nr:hypothetical protein MAJHIDBO_00132 [Propionibacterium freudenreichii subsp. shermanii]SPS07821.1 hypothetical protein MAJHIDBO_00132 [Propionibacterium freudenreichii subsp. shermanii]
MLVTGSQGLLGSRELVGGPLIVGVKIGLAVTEAGDATLQREIGLFGLGGPGQGLIAALAESIDLFGARLEPRIQ